MFAFKWLSPETLRWNCLDSLFEIYVIVIDNSNWLKFQFVRMLFLDPYKHTHKRKIELHHAISYAIVEICTKPLTLTWRKFNKLRPTAKPFKCLRSYWHKLPYIDDILKYIHKWKKKSICCDDGSTIIINLSRIFFCFWFFLKWLYFIKQIHYLNNLF